MIDRNKVDKKENDVLRYDSQLLTILLKDNSTKQHIIWATDNYVVSGPEYDTHEQITIPLISGKNGNINKPRYVKYDLTDEEIAFIESTIKPLE